MASSNNPMEWMIEHLACTDNYGLLQSLPIHSRAHTDTDDTDNARRFDEKTEKLLTVSTLKNMISTTSASRLYQHTLQSSTTAISRIFTEYHKLYPRFDLTDVNNLQSLQKNERDEFQKWVARLFENEMQLKMQIVICAQFWKSDYVQHKRLNDQLLHPAKYHIRGNECIAPSRDPSQSEVQPSDPLIPRADIVQYVCEHANGIHFISCCHTQLDYIGQQCTNPALNLQHLHNATVRKIHQFLDTHSFTAFRDKFMQTMDVAQSKLCLQGKDFLSRISRADLSKILRGELPRTPSPVRVAARSRARSHSDPLQPPAHREQLLISSPSSRGDREKESEAEQHQFALRNVVDVKMKGNWSSGTVIKCYGDGSLKIALHKEAPDTDGNYQYDTHLTIRHLDDVIHCINEDGEYEMDENPQLLVDESSNQSQFSSPLTQQQIRTQKRLQLSPTQRRHRRHSYGSSPLRNNHDFQQIVADRNRRKKNKNSNQIECIYSLDDDDEDNAVDTGYERDHEESVDANIRKALDEHAVQSQSTDITEPVLSNQLSPTAVQRTRNERMQQFQIRSSSKSKSATHSASKSPSRPRRKRSRDEYENEQPQQAHDEEVPSPQSKTSKKKKVSASLTAKESKHTTKPPTPKRRKVDKHVERTIVTRSVAKAAQQREIQQQQQQSPQKQTSGRRTSPRLAQRRRDSLVKQQQQQQQQQIEEKKKERQMMEEQKKKKKKKKVQTKIASTKDNTITYAKSQSKKKRKKKAEQNQSHNHNKKRKENEVEDEEDEGEEIEWSDMSDAEMKKLAKTVSTKKATKHKKKGKWTDAAEEALKACYAKHDKIRQRVNQYHLWEQIKRDSEYCKYWSDRTAVSIRDKARALLGLDKKTEKNKTSDKK